jgi:hypothetical protein
VFQTTTALVIRFRHPAWQVCAPLFAAHFPIPAKHEPVSELVQSLAFVELSSDAPAVDFAFEVSQRVDGLRQAPLGLR